MEYDDGRVACDDSGLILRWYYFPAGTKRVPYSAIRTVHRRAARRGRIWGSSDFVHWYNLDPGRPRKTVELVIDSGRVKPVITPTDPNGVIAALRRHGVDIAE
jgi:hypothetical protein